MTIASVLFIPAKGHEALLAEGPCGARAPIVWFARGRWYDDHSVAYQVGGHPRPKRALALAWNGKAHRKECNDLGIPLGWSARGDWVVGQTHREGAWGVAHDAAKRGLGTFVLLDAERNDVTP